VGLRLVILRAKRSRSALCPAGFQSVNLRQPVGDEKALGRSPFQGPRAFALTLAQAVDSISVRTCGDLMLGADCVERIDCFGNAERAAPNSRRLGRSHPLAKQLCVEEPSSAPSPRRLLCAVGDALILHHVGAYFRANREGACGALEISPPFGACSTRGAVFGRADPVADPLQTSAGLAVRDVLNDASPRFHSDRASSLEVTARCRRKFLIWVENSRLLSTQDLVPRRPPSRTRRAVE